MAQTQTCKRLQKELQGIQAQSKDSMVTAAPVEGDLTHWKGTLKGPEDTPYQDGIYEIDIIIPADYPFAPPKMKFETKIWHPNISSQTGCICLDVLGKEWSPALGISTALLSIQALLSSPEPDDPQDAVVAQMYKQNNTLFKETAKHWTETYASGKKVLHDPPVAATQLSAEDQDDLVDRALQVFGFGHVPMENLKFESGPSLPSCCDGASSRSGARLHSVWHPGEQNVGLLRHPLEQAPRGWCMDENFRHEAAVQRQFSRVHETLPLGLENQESKESLRLCSSGKCVRTQQYLAPGLFAMGSFMLALTGLKKLRGFQKIVRGQEPLMCK